MADAPYQLSDADQAAMAPETYANPFVKNMIAGAVQTASIPGRMMEPNPYAPGSEEAYAYDRMKSDVGQQWAARTAMSMIRPAAGVGAGFGVGERLPQRPVVTSAMEQQRNYQPGLIASGQAASGQIKRDWAQTSPIKTIDHLFEKAPENQAQLSQAAGDIAQQLGVEWKNPGIKGRARTQEKVDIDGKAPGRINDVVRGGFVLNTPEQADAISAHLAQRFQVADEGWFTTPHGYTDRKLLVRFPNGQVGEVQMWDQATHVAKHEGHALYAQARALKPDDPRLPGLEEEMRKVYARGFAARGPEWNAVLGGGGNEGNSALNAASSMTRASWPTTAELTRRQAPFSNAQASPGVQIAGSPSQMQNVNFMGPSKDIMEEKNPSRKDGGQVGYAGGGTPTGAEADPDFQAWKQANAATAPAATGAEADPDFQAWKKNQPMDMGEVAGQAVANAPGSALQFLKDTARPFMHPMETISGIGDLVRGAAEKQQSLYADALGKPMPEGQHEKYANAMAGYLADRYGGIENVKRSFAKDPVGVLSDASMLLTMGGTSIERMPGIMGKTGEIMSKVGRATDPLMAPVTAAQGAAKGIGEMLTHTGAPAIENAYRTGVEGGEAGEKFREHMRGQAPMEEPVDIAKQGLEQFRQDRGAAYRKGMAGVNAEDSALGIENQMLDFGKIDAAVKKSLNVQTFKGQVLDPGANTVRSEMIDAIDNWKQLPPSTHHTVEGIDALKRQLGNMMQDTAPNTSARKAAGDIYNAVRQTIVDQAPGYAKVMKDYERASALIKDIESSLSLGKRANVDTSLRKLQSIMRNNVNTNFGRRVQLGQLLEENGATHLMAALSGQSLNAWFPRGLGKLEAAGTALTAFSHPMAAASLPFMSPRLMGEAAHVTGRTAGRVLQKSNEMLGKVLPSDRIYISPNRAAGNASYRLGRGTNPYENAP